MVAHDHLGASQFSLQGRLAQYARALRPFALPQPAHHELKEGRLDLVVVGAQPTPAALSIRAAGAQLEVASPHVV